MAAHENGWSATFKPLSNIWFLAVSHAAAVLMDFDEVPLPIIGPLTCNRDFSVNRLTSLEVGIFDKNTAITLMYVVTY